MVDPPLAGFTVGITADRRRDELESLLVRRGARVVSGPALRILPVAQDDQLRAVTEELVAAPPDVVVANTGVGFRGWVEAADGWGLLQPLLSQLVEARVVVRGPKAAGAVRAAGLREEWSPPGESSDEVLTYLLDKGVDGLRIAVQLHGEPQTAFCTALRDAGADVVEAAVYRWVPPEDTEPMQRLIDGVLDGEVDALAFTSAPAVVSLLQHAGDRRDALVHAMRTDLVVACVGPVCARPLVAEGVPSLLPDRMRLGAMVRSLTDALPLRAERLRLRGHELEVRGHAAFVDGVQIELDAISLAVLRALVRARGGVVLLTQLPHCPDEHAVEASVARLRAALGDASLVRATAANAFRLDADMA